MMVLVERRVCGGWTGRGEEMGVEMCWREEGKRMRVGE